MFLMDNDGKLGNDTMRVLGNSFGINVKHTAGYSPWSNSVNEHNHATVDLMLTKMLEDLLNLDERMSLQYCISLKNCIYIRVYSRIYPSSDCYWQNPKISISDTR